MVNAQYKSNIIFIIIIIIIIINIITIQRFSEFLKKETMVLDEFYSAFSKLKYFVEKDRMK